MPIMFHHIWAKRLCRSICLGSFCIGRQGIDCGPGRGRIGARGAALGPQERHGDEQTKFSRSEFLNTDGLNAVTIAWPRHGNKCPPLAEPRAELTRYGHSPAVGGIPGEGAIGVPGGPINFAMIVQPETIPCHGIVLQLRNVQHFTDLLFRSQGHFQMHQNTQ
jgi:hypothetical protein